uniref:hypothetical protein n=1 Tax=Catenibacterium mitsuokai TaxID=100886 RepID=UPI003D77051D
MEHKEENIKNKLKKYTSDKLIYIIVTVTAGLLLDIYVNLTENTFITVTESYISSIYSAIVTVAVLCISLIALISDKLEKTYYGYKLKEIILFEESVLNFKKYLYLSFGSMALATIAFLFEYEISVVNTITALILAEIYLEFLMTTIIFKTIINETYCYEIVESHIKNDKVQNGEESQEEYEREIIRLFNSLKYFTEAQNQEKVNKVTELIVILNEKNKTLTENDKVYQVLLNQLREIVIPLADNFGYNQMIKDIILLSNHTRLEKAGKEDLYIIPIENMMFWDDETFLKNNYFNQIIKICYISEYSDNKITDNEIEYILYKYFVSIINNRLSTEKVRNQLIVNYLNELSHFYWGKSNDCIVPVDSKTLLDVFKEYVLKNENHKEREYIYKLILKNVYVNNRYYNSNIFPLTISYMLQSFYSYIYCEKELLNEDYRNSLKDLFLLTISDKTNKKFKFSDLVADHIKAIVPAVAKRIEKNDNIEQSFEFFISDYLCIKNTVWTDSFNKEFLLMLYLIYYTRLLPVSFLALFNEWDKVRDEVVNIIWDKFDLSTKKIKEEFRNQCNQFAQLLNCNYSINDDAEKELFESINEEKKKINQIQEIPQECNIEEITNKLCDLMEQEKVFGWDTELTKGTKMNNFKFSNIEENKWITNNFTAKKFKATIINAVHYAINSYASKITVETNGDLDLTELSNLRNNYNARNFNFNEYLTYDQCKDFSSPIKDIENNTNYVDTSEIRIPILFNKDEFKFNAQIISKEDIDLTDDECIEYLREFKAYNGFYDVNGALYPKDEAIEIIKKQYKKEVFQFKLLVSFNKEDILYINFKY